MQQEKQEGHVGEAPPTEDGVVQKRASISSDSKTGQTDEIPSKGCRGDSDAENPSTICHSAETTPAGGAGGRDISSACITCDWFKDLIIKITTTEYSGLRVPPIRDRIPANRAMIPLCFQ